MAYPPRKTYYNPSGHMCWDQGIDKSAHHMVYTKIPEKKRAIITLNNPEKLNAVSRADHFEMMKLLDEIEADDEVKVVVIRGEGEVFGSGAHGGMVGFLHGIQHGVPGERKAPQRTRLSADRWYFQDMWQKWQNCYKITICEAKGYTIGSHMWWALTSDIVIASDDVVFGHPAYRWVGASVDGLMAVMIHTIGIRAAKRLMIAGKWMEAEDALRCGMVTEVVPKAQLEKRVDEWATAVAMQPIDGICTTKAAFEVAQATMGLKAGITVGAAMHAINSNIRFEEDEWNYFRDRRDRGLKDAMRERDKRFENIPGFAFPFRKHKYQTTKTHVAEEAYENKFKSVGPAAAAQEKQS
ncbi:MAG: enoyl-CoA hydratase/isomerase family protein [Chloroflexi bacterium]|nr:enoyl-CoA hydratase/isomerase family protein [Chloroflexota bacterium]